MFVMFKSNSLRKSEKLAVFFWCRRGQKGTGGADIHTVTMWRRGYVGAPNWELHRSCMVLMVALTVLNFAGIFCFGSSLLIDCKIEVGIFMIDRLFYQRYHCERLFAKEE